VDARPLWRRNYDRCCHNCRSKHLFFVAILDMKSERLLAALLLLQAHRKLPGRELAARLEVSARTAHRYMEALSAAGVPVFATRGAQGGWQIEDGWRTQVPGLDDAELRALLMAQPRVIGDSDLAASAERALTKLLAALPGAMRERAASMRQRLHVDTTGWRGAASNLSALPIVQDALARDRMLTITYRQAGRDQVERTIHPLGLVAKGTTWYLVANTPGSLRTYRVSRIDRAAILDTPCQRPADFDLAAYWRSAAEQFRQKRRYEATLRLEPAAADALKTWCDVRPVRTGERFNAGGQVTVAVQFDSESDACFMVLGFGPRAEVVAPVSLRTRVAGETAAAFERLDGSKAETRRRRRVTSRGTRRTLLSRSARAG
jgi:predicted DNA-binding transcriptional regulator YafY